MLQPRHLAALILIVSVPEFLTAAPPKEAMIQVRLGSGLVEGKPLAWSPSQVVMLGRDGQLVSFRPGGAKEYRTSSPRFYSYSTGEMRNRLYAEFGRDFEVTGTGHYLVVHPKGQKDKWAQRFEDLYRSFYHYFTVRGFNVNKPEFPLVAVVFKNKADYQRHAAASGTKISPNYLGHYSRNTNRIYLFDTTEDGGDWSQNADTIIHEATHQTAFNTGVHTRFAGTPRWVTEGLATMFEARGVWDSMSFRSQADRINRGRLADFKHFLDSRPAGFLEQLVESDRPFSTNPSAAYAESWALSFYLCETRPRQYTKYLALTAERPTFEEYTAEQRLDDFTSVFGKNFKQLEAQFLRYMNKVR